MFIAAGQPGNSRKVMASVAAARKVFRILRVSLCTAIVVRDPASLVNAPTTISD